MALQARKPSDPRSRLVKRREFEGTSVRENEDRRSVEVGGLEMLQRTKTFVRVGFDSG